MDFQRDCSYMSFLTKGEENVDDVEEVGENHIEDMTVDTEFFHI